MFVSSVASIDAIVGMRALLAAATPQKSAKTGLKRKIGACPACGTGVAKLRSGEQMP
jgi:hypothetical protein